jgi:oligopeptidase B
LKQVKAILFTRKKGSLDAAEEIMFDCNELAEGHKYFKLSGLSISIDNQYATYALDL